MGAGDWIAMRVHISSVKQALFVRHRCGLSADEVVGKLHRFWSWTDAETEDGVIDGVTFEAIDELVGAEGFAAALAEFPEDPWLIKTETGVYVPHFQTYNGKSAKKRLVDNRRKTSARKADRKRTKSGQKADECPENSGQKAPKSGTTTTATTTDVQPPPTTSYASNNHPAHPLPHNGDGDYFDGPKTDTEAIHRHFHKLTARPPLTGAQRANGEGPGLDEDIQCLIDVLGLEELKARISLVVADLLANKTPCRTLRKAINEVQKAVEPTSADPVLCANCGSERTKKVRFDQAREMDIHECQDCECQFETRYNPYV